VIGEREMLLRHVLLEHHALQDAGAIAHQQKVQLAARALVVEPALERDGLTLVSPDVLDVDPGSVAHHWPHSTAA
jgi:hypothetical protein